MSKKHEKEDSVKIPIGKVRRAAKMMGTGAKIGGNYLKYYAQRLVDPDTGRDDLDEANASELYESLSELKGTALKVAQMMSMDQTVLPRAYGQKFEMAQYKAPPLSYPLVVKTFKSNFGKEPNEIFDSFSKEAVNAASIGQVHRAELKGKKLAVKVQYPGVAESVASDLKLVKPIAVRMMNVKSRDLDQYLNEVKSRLLEETDYHLELERSKELTEKCAHIDNLVFPVYYPEYSRERVLTMDWVEGVPLRDWIKMNPSQEDRDRIGQAMWDFYAFQVHKLKLVHADPHPGNFIITPDTKLSIIDFGCVKKIPEDFYHRYFKLMEPGIAEDRGRFVPLLTDLGVFLPDDSEQERTFFTEMLVKMLRQLSKPFAAETFDFGDDRYFEQLFSLGEEISTDKRFRRSKIARGSLHGIYINRTFFGLYNLLHLIRARVNPGMRELIANLDEGQ